MITNEKESYCYSSWLCNIKKSLSFLKYGYIIKQRQIDIWKGTLRLGLFDKFKKSNSKIEVCKKDLSTEIRLQLINCDYAPEDMQDQLPISCQLIRMIPGNDRHDYWLAKCDCPVKYGEAIINYLVVAPRFVGVKIEKGMGANVLNVAYVTDESIVQDATLNFDKCRYVAICETIEF